MLSTQQREHLKSIIQQQIKALQKEIHSLQDAHDPVPPDTALGRLSRLDTIRDKNMQKAALKAAQIRLNQLQIALANFETDNFGLCQTCGNDIPVARLELMPETIICVSCAEKH